MATNVEQKLLSAITRDLKLLREIAPGHRASKSARGGSGTTLNLSFYRRTPAILDETSRAIKRQFPGPVRVYNSRLVIDRPWGAIHFATPELPNTSAEISLIPREQFNAIFRRATRDTVKH